MDDHADPFGELSRLVAMGVVNDFWNRGWTAFMEKRFAEALKWQEQATARAEAQPAMLPEVVYDLAVIRLAAGDEARRPRRGPPGAEAEPEARRAGRIRPRPRGDPGGAAVGPRSGRQETPGRRSA